MLLHWVLKDCKKRDSELCAFVFLSDTGKKAVSVYSLVCALMCINATDVFICYVICQSWHCVSMHILHVYTINCIWGTCTCPQSISRGAAYICSSLINSMQNAICQLRCHRLQLATCVFIDGSGGKLKSQQASSTPPPQTSVQSQSLTCCFTSDTNTWEKDGVHSVCGKALMDSVSSLSFFHMAPLPMFASFSNSLHLFFWWFNML